MDYSTRNNFCFIGLTQWQHSAWQDQLLYRPVSASPLSAYSRYFSSVEGNTTFYGLPKADSIKLWDEDSPDSFRFCFKFPQEITHHQQLNHCAEATSDFLKRLAPLQSKLGVLSIQLPASFSASDLPLLARYLESLPDDFAYGVEVRNLDFFNKGKEEQDFNQLLQQHQVNRISFDTRALFAHPAEDAISQKAKEHKPQLPVHALATAGQPLIRFITPLDWQWGCNYLTPWLNKAEHWLAQGKSPYFFFHTPDNAEAPELAKWFAAQLKQRCPDKVLFSEWPDNRAQQNNLF